MRNISDLSSQVVKNSSGRLLTHLLINFVKRINLFALFDFLKAIKDLILQIKKLERRVQLGAQKLAENEEKQQKLSSEVKILENGNKESFKDLFDWKIIIVEKNSARFSKCSFKKSLKIF